jgi:hypothetical protein
MVALDNRLEAQHDVGGLGSVGAGAHAQIDIRFRDAQLAKEEVTHPLVIMLAGVNQQCLDAGLRAKGIHERSHLHEVGTGADDVEDSHAFKGE